MKERGIIFNTEMVRAIMEGRKTQTRRPVKRENVICAAMDGYNRPKSHCPYGQVGDRLYVRETFLDDFAIGGQDENGNLINIIFRADSEDKGTYPRWKPSIHMPKSAARIWLEITDVRVERVQDISENDAKKEGLDVKKYGSHPFFCTRDYSRPMNKTGWFPGYCADNGSQFRDSFKTLWCSIYNNWNQNPWVWVIEFKVIKK